MAYFFFIKNLAQHFKSLELIGWFPAEMNRLSMWQHTHIDHIKYIT